MFIGSVSAGLVALGLIATATPIGTAFYAFGLILLVTPPQRLAIQGLRAGYWQGFRTIAGMIGVVTAILAGSAAGLIAAVAAGHSGVVGFVVGGVVAVAVLVALMSFQSSAW